MSASLDARWRKSGKRCATPSALLLEERRTYKLLGGEGVSAIRRKVAEVHSDVGQVTGEFGQVRRTVQSVSREVDRLGRTTAELEREVEGVKHEVHDVSREVARLAVSPVNLSSGPSRAPAQVERAPQVGSRIAVKEEGEDAVLGSFNGLPAPGGDVPMSGLPSSSSAESKASPLLWTAPIDTSTSSALAQVTSTAASSLASQDQPMPSPTVPFSPTLALGGPSPLTPVRRAPSVTARELTSPPMRSVGSAWVSGRRHGSGNVYHTRWETTRRIPPVRLARRGVSALRASPTL